MSVDIAAREKVLPGDFAIWIFILAELLVFGVFFLTYAVVRSQHVALFNAYQLTLNKGYGVVNTLALITSSYFVVMAISAIRRDRREACIAWLVAAMVAGMVFVVIKVVEFSEKYDQGINLSTNTFYTFYLSMTFFHFMHVIMGLVILLAVAVKAGCGAYSANNHLGIETGASYWHMVDLVWIVLFPLLYLVR